MNNSVLDEGFERCAIYSAWGPVFRRGNIEYGGAALSERASDLYPQNTERALEKTSG